MFWSLGILSFLCIWKVPCRTDAVSELTRYGPHFQTETKHSAQITSCAHKVLGDAASALDKDQGSGLIILLQTRKVSESLKLLFKGNLWLPNSNLTTMWYHSSWSLRWQTLQKLLWGVSVFTGAADKVHIGTAGMAGLQKYIAWEQCKALHCT